jgi:hypothetical protein
VNWNKQETIEARMAFIGALGPLFMFPVVYVDKTGFNLHIKKLKGRTIRGELLLLL